MTLYVVRPPNPAPGADWRTVVPGQYLYNVTGITAQLDSAIPVTTLADSSGNGWTLAVLGGSPQLTFGAAGPFAGGANNYAVSGNGDRFNQAWIGVSATDPTWQMAQFTAECWLNVGAATSAFGFSAVAALTVNASNGWQTFYAHTAGSPTSFRQQVPLQGPSPANTLLSRSVWHHLATTYDGVNWNQYIDGALVLSQAAPNRNDGGAMRAVIGGGNIGGWLNGSQGPTAIYPAALTGAQIAAHAAASGSNAAYKAAALADSPKGLWMLDTVPNVQSRTVALEITDGQRVVASFPAPFPVAAAGGPLLYSWAPAFSSSSQTPTAGVNTVSIPPLLLPAGYTIGTRTLDIVPTDQWSNIVVWWDSDVMDAGGGYSPYVYPPGAHLVYERRPGV